jgi:predicted DNA-binding transcriptional regulator AlpA
MPKLKPRSIPDALRRFDELPDSAYVRLPVVMGLLDASDGTVWRYARRGIIPAPVQLGPRCTAWNVGELRAALGRMRGAA